MKALWDRSVAQEGVISHLGKRNENLTNEQDQYKDALRTLNKEVTELNEKLKEEGCQKEKEQEAKVTLEKRLMALLGQVEAARVDAIIEFTVSQPFISAYTIYYGDGIEDCLKHVKFVYLYLDLSKVTMDDSLPSTLAGDIVFEETDDFTELERDPKNDGVIFAQHAVEKTVTPSIPSTEAPQDVENLPTQDAQDPPSKDDENPLA